MDVALHHMDVTLVPPSVLQRCTLSRQLLSTAGALSHDAALVRFMWHRLLSCAMLNNSTTKLQKGGFLICVLCCTNVLAFV